MGRKRSGGKQMPAIEERTKPVRLDLDPETHRLLRIVAVIAGSNMAAYARDLVRDHVRSEAQKKGLK